MHFLLLVLMAAAIQNTPQNPTGSITGTVMQVGTTVPIAGALVKASMANSAAGGGVSEETLTDGTGRFAFSGLAAGRYTVSVNKEGYLFGYSQSTGLNPTHTFIVTLSAGQGAQLAPLPAAAAGTIRARIVDKDDKPIADAIVDIVPTKNDELGRQVWRTLSGAAVRTDEEGEYRRTMLAPGPYYVRTILEGRGSFPTTVYYPGTADANAAAAVAVGEGSEISVTIHVGAAIDDGAYQILGKVVYPRSQGQDPAGVVLKERDSIRGESPRSSYARVSDTTGEFAFRGIRPGNYDLFATSNIEGSEYFSKVPVEIRDKDRDDVELVLVRGREVAGRLIIDGEPQDLEFMRSPTVAEAAGRRDTRSHAGDVSIGLSRKDGFFGSDTIKAVIADSGTSFTFTDVPAGDYRFLASLAADGRPPDPNLYIADVRAGGKSVFDDGLLVGGDVVDAIDVIIGTKGGSIVGSVVGMIRDRPSVLIVVPESFRRANASLYRRLNLGPNVNGQFELHGLAPGNYKLFAIPARNEIVSSFSPEFVAQYESRATTVLVQRGMTTSGVQIRLLP
jgi:hypothetical protein